MKCPYCLLENTVVYSSLPIGIDKEGDWEIQYGVCSKCNKVVARLIGYEVIRGISYAFYQERGKVFVDQLIKPRIYKRRSFPDVVPSYILQDYHEASLVLVDSPKASAALSRRCLQSILREKCDIKHGDLNDEIQQVIDKKLLPFPIELNIDAVRNIGNFAAHPTKSKSTGEIVEVEPAEAEWNLQVIESLIDYFYVQLEDILMQRSRLDKKLLDAGRKKMK